MVINKYTQYTRKRIYKMYMRFYFMCKHKQLYKSILLKSLWKTVFKMLKSQFFINYFAENSVENVKNVKALTCIQQIIKLFYFMKRNSVFYQNE